MFVCVEMDHGAYLLSRTKDTRDIEVEFHMTGS